MLRCDYAACDDAATDRAGSWVFCPTHLREHLRLANQPGEDWNRQYPNFGTAMRAANAAPNAGCGTEAGAKAHYRRGEQPCRACRDAANERSRGRLSA